MKNNLISGEERRKENMNKLMDLRIKTKNYSRTRIDITWIILLTSKIYDVYINGLEILSEQERQVVV